MTTDILIDTDDVCDACERQPAEVAIIGLGCFCTDCVDVVRAAAIQWEETQIEKEKE